MKELKSYLSILFSIFFCSVVIGLCSVVIGPWCMLCLGVWTPESISWNRVLILNCIAVFWAIFLLVNLIVTNGELEGQNELLAKRLAVTEEVAKWSSRLQSEEHPHPCPDLALRALYRAKTREAIEAYEKFRAKNG